MHHYLTAKFICSRTTSDRTGFTQVELEAIPDGTGENRIFSDSTPNGKISMNIKYRDTASFFVPGTEYHVSFAGTNDFEPVLARDGVI